MFALVNWVTFFSAMAAIELTPGPNMGWLAALSARAGRKAGMAAVGGIALGLAIQVVAAATGLSAIAAASPTLYHALRWAGVLFMVYLAWDAWRDGPENSPGETGESFRHGLIANLLNPKALVFYMLVVGQFTNPAAGNVWLQIILLGSIHVLIATAVHGAIVLSASSLGNRIERWRASVPVRAGFALALLAVAAWVTMTTGRDG